MASAPAKTPVKMRKNPTQARATATVDAIVEAAAQIMRRDGEGAVTTGAVAERAGVSIGSIYQYFPNRDAILAALIRREREAIAAEVARSIGAIDPENGEQTVRRVVATVVEAFRPRRRRRKLAELGTTLRAEEGGATALLDGIAALLMGASRGRFDFGHRPLTETSAYVLTRAVMGAVRSAVTENNRILDDPAFEEELSRLALAYLRG